MVCITFIKTEELNTFQGADHSSNDYPADERDHVPRDILVNIFWFSSHSQGVKRLTQYGLLSTTSRYFSLCLSL